jgi:V-type H+-transporting ATPase subunit C
LKKQLQQDQKLCDCFEFRIPKLRVATLDQLMALSDDLIKYDSSLENIAIKILRQLQEAGDANQDFVPEVIMQEDNTAPVELYLNFFQWDENQYLLTKPIKDITEQIHKKALKFDEELKIKSGEYQTLKTNISTIERKRTGALTVKLLDGIVKKEHIVDTEYLQTVFVVVPKNLQKEWLNKYESLHEMVVPGSSELIVEDNEYALYNVVVIRKIAKDFEKKCSEHKFIPREFQYDEKREQLSMLETEKMNEKRETMKKELCEWCKMAFSETFSAWIHLKAIRTFVESVLRYGLPPKFVSLLLKVTKNEKKIHKFFTENYKYLQEDHPTVSGDEHAVAGLAGYGDFYPYVLITINSDAFFK